MKNKKKNPMDIELLIDPKAYMTSETFIYCLCLKVFHHLYDFLRITLLVQFCLTPKGFEARFGALVHI